MPITKRRISLSVDDDLYRELESLKDLKGAPSLSAVVIELIQEALGIQEDLYFAKIASERERGKTIPHDRFWKRQK